MADSENVKIAAAISIPRLGFNDSWGSIADAFRPFGIPVRRFTGAFWDQCLERVLEKFVVDGVDWAITLDYDTVFTQQQLSTMFSVFAQNPHIDALCALQRKRNAETALLSAMGQEEGEIEVNPNEPLQISTAHFGLTLLRVDALKRTPKPWFTGLPSPTGQWKQEHSEHFEVDPRWAAVRDEYYKQYDIPESQQQKTDPDIWFWRQWERAGNTCYCLPSVSIGHLEIYCSHFDAQGNPRLTNVDTWMDNQKSVSEEVNHGREIEETVAEPVAG